MNKIDKILYKLDESNKQKLMNKINNITIVDVFKLLPLRHKPYTYKVYKFIVDWRGQNEY